MFWTDTLNQRVERASIDSSNRMTLFLQSNLYPRGIAIDAQEERIYWTGEGFGTVERMNFDGTGHEVLVTGVSGPRGIALDFVSQKVYWVERITDRIHRAEFDGQNVEIVIDTGLVDPLQIAIDSEANHLYISDNGLPAGSDGRLLRASLDGSNLISIVEGLGDPTGIALDAAASKIYWVDNFQNNISRANLDGSNVVELVSNGPGGLSPLGLALDVDGGKMYWTESGGAGRIRRAALDGSNVEILIDTGLSNPRDIAVDARCSSLPNGTPCENYNPCDDDDVCMHGSCKGTDQCTNLRFFLLITEVNGVQCPNCPTSELSIGEALPGDVLTIEAYFENWDLDSPIGRCESGLTCIVEQQDCTTKHCALNHDMYCEGDLACGVSGPCVLDTCLSFPAVRGYRWTVDPLSLSSGLAGALSPYDVPCESDFDCENGTDQCTCDGASCVSSTCEIEGAFFIDASRPDWVFAGNNATYFSAHHNFPEFVQADAEGRGVLDPGVAVYLGSIRLKVSEDATGTFIVESRRAEGGITTQVVDQRVSPIEAITSVPVTINLCETVDLTNDCNNNEIPDECEVDGDGDGMIDVCDACPNDATNDSDGDGACDSLDGCPTDGGKIAPGLCGCGKPDSGDSDDDQVLDCVDQCPGINDQLFGSECASAIPAVSTWGLVILALISMVGAKVAFHRQRVT